jgi:uncharacterized protein (TIGR03437 family)
LGQGSNGFTIPVVAAQPGIFTANASGSGPAAALNQNGTLNSPSNPANRGDALAIYLTGEGQTNAAGVTGQVNCPSGQPCSISGLPVPLLPVTVRIGGQISAVTFAAESPGTVSGLLQVNAVIPTSLVQTGDLPIEVTIGSNVSQTGVTVSIR